MRRVREILRLIRDADMPARAVARQLGVAASTVRETVRRFEASGMEWPLPAALNDTALEIP
nr:AsnC family protein [Sphingomonas populi]